MNLYLRLLWLALTAWMRPPAPIIGPVRTRFCVWPSDLDVLLHVNNGVYLSMMDLGRVDLMKRAGMFGRVTRRGWYPVVVAQSIRYRRSLKLFDRFAIETRVLGWDQKAFLIEQRFERGGEIVAHALVRARFLSKRGETVSPAEVLAVADSVPPMPVIPEHAAQWNADHTAWPASAAAPHSGNRL
jgi:acyl-CoA thioesterase FadM